MLGIVIASFRRRVGQLRHSCVCVCVGVLTPSSCLGAVRERIDAKLPLCIQFLRVACFFSAQSRRQLAMSVLSRCGACLCAFAAFAAATQVIDVAMEEPTGSASDALAAFEFEKDAAAQKAKIAETVARATAKLDAALAGIGASKQHVSSAALEETLKTAASKLDVRLPCVA